MRFLLAVFLALPTFAQQPATPPAVEQTAAKPEEKAAAPAEQKSDAKAESPAPSAEQWLSGDLDFGYRWLTDIRGSQQEYRSVVNLGEGPKLLGFNATIMDPKKRLFDRLDLRAMGWGGDPYNTAHLSARKSGVYDLSFDYRNIAYFNAVPSFANPLAPGGFNEQAFDLHRRNEAFTIEFLPGRRIIPYLGFEHNSGSGRGIDTWVQESNNSFAVPVVLRDSTNNYRGGVRFELNRFHVTLEQGGTTFKDDDQSYFQGVNLGDRTTPILGQTEYLSGLAQAYGIRGTSIYSKVLATANVNSWLNLYGQFLFSEPKIDVHFNDQAYGNFAALSSLIFFSGQQNIGTGAANQPHTSSNVGWTGRVGKRFRFVESFMSDQYHDAASSLLSTTLALTPSTTTQALNPLAYTQTVNYFQNQVDVFFDLTSHITFRGGFRRVWGDATVLAGNLSQTGTTVSGELNRNVALGGFTFRPSEKLSLNLDYEASASDRIYFRTSLNDYHRARGRLRYQIVSALALQTNFQVLNNQNPSPDIRYDFQSRDNSLSLFWTPAGGKRITVMAEYDRNTLRSNISYLGLFLAPMTSNYIDHSNIGTSAIDVAIPHLSGGKITAGGSLFTSAGSRPTRYYQPLARLTLPLHKNVYWNTEWKYYGFGEQFYVFEGFRTHSLTTGIRVTK